MNLATRKTQQTCQKRKQRRPKEPTNGTIELDAAENRSKIFLISWVACRKIFLTQFASAEGKNGGQFYTPRCVVRVLVERLEPCKGRVYDPCCGSAGMFVQSEKFVEEHGGRFGDIAVYGQESNSTTWRLSSRRSQSVG